MRDPLATSADRRRAREALSAGKRAYAVTLRQDGATLVQIGAALTLSSTRVGQLLAKAEHLAARPRWHGQFPAHALNFLIVRDLADKPEIEAAEALARLTVKELKEAPGLGKDAIGALAAWLERLGLTLRDLETNPDATKPTSRVGFAECAPVAGAATIVHWTEQSSVPSRAMVRKPRAPSSPFSGPEGENLTLLRCPNGRRKIEYP
jgi:hypothetical protein